VDLDIPLSDWQLLIQSINPFSPTTKCSGGRNDSLALRKLAEKSVSGVSVNPRRRQICILSDAPTFERLPRFARHLTARIQIGNRSYIRYTQNLLPFSPVKYDFDRRKFSSALLPVVSNKVSRVSVIPRRVQISLLSASEGGPDSLAKNRPRSSNSLRLLTVQS
jgi:hypothetical protein